MVRKTKCCLKPCLPKILVPVLCQFQAVFFSQKNFKHRLVYPIKDDPVLIKAQSGADPGDVDKILSNGESGSFECLVFSTETDF